MFRAWTLVRGSLVKVLGRKVPGGLPLGRSPISARHVVLRASSPSPTLGPVRRFVFEAENGDSALTPGRVSCTATVIHQTLHHPGTFVETAAIIEVAAN